MFSAGNGVHMFSAHLPFLTVFKSLFDSFSSAKGHAIGEIGPPCRHKLSPSDAESLFFLPEGEDDLLEEAEDVLELLPMRLKQEKVQIVCSVQFHAFAHCILWFHLCLRLSS